MRKKELEFQSKLGCENLRECVIGLCDLVKIVNLSPKRLEDKCYKDGFQTEAV